jgi:hypothetical protein
VIMAKNLLTDKLSEPLSGATTARVDIHAGDGNLTIDGLNGDEQVLASGTLEYFENRGRPTRSLVSDNGQATFTLRGSGAGRPWFHFPWAACNGATEWQIHLNPNVASGITAHSDGGNLKLDLSSMAVNRLSAGTGGGNIDVVLPDCATNLDVTAQTGAGNVTVEIGHGLTGNSLTGKNSLQANSGAGNVVVRIPSHLAARIQATTGLGKTTVDPRFSMTGKNTYQSPDFDSAADKVDIKISSGAGNVSVDSR